MPSSSVYSHGPTASAGVFLTFCTAIAALAQRFHTL